ncbi:MAG: DUF1844 domain-containing protein [Candidatus Omnitrophica bacterium]|nr:DUF1844 domain-containing protein [Candidatus Omnitrophota bacterium]
MEEEKKKVDEAWKQQAEKEKSDNNKESPPTSREEQLPEADFSFFITTLAVQASIALGAMANPVTQKIELNLSQAKLIIDTLGVLKVKTQGNLSSEEDSLLENMLYELRMQYLTQTKGEQK